MEGKAHQHLDKEFNLHNEKGWFIAILGNV